MKLLPAALILGAVACAPVLAQQKENAIKPPVEVSVAKIQALQSPQSSASQTSPQSPESTTQAPLFSQNTVRLIVPEAQFVVRDGAVYLSLSLGGALVPMPGGGASGCFSLDLPARIENLKKFIEAFPPKQSTTTQTPLIRHTSVLQRLYIYAP